MGDRVTVGGLQVAAVLHAFVRDEALPGYGHRRGAPSGRGVEAILRDFAPAQPRAAGPPRRAPAAARRVAREEPGPGPRPGGVRRSCCATSATSSTSPPTSPSRPATSTTRSPSRPARSSSCRCSTRGSPPTPPTPAGARSTTRSTAPTRCPRTTARSAGRRRTTRSAAPAVIARARAFLDEHFPLEHGQPRRRDAATPSRTARLTVTLRRRRVRARRPDPVRRPPRRPGRPRGRAAGPPRAARRDPGRPRPTPSARTTPPA